MNTIQDMPGGLLSTVNPSKETAAKSAAETTQDRFMKLLVTQMKNQDPLNPMDNAQVTSQMAQLSTVTGIDKMNATLEALNGSYKSNQALQSAGMIGHGVLVPGNNVGLVDGKAFLGIELTEPADNVEVTIKDASGKAIRTISLGAQQSGTLPLSWDGTDSKGVVAPNGQYSFSVSATRAGQPVDGVTALSFGMVNSVSNGTQGVKLSVANVGEVDMSAVRQIL